jgi:2-C-methyl-D-erythritol 4-phosphate cytidylyltransferase / 2-C-methyl-D-erythritol 2,4-cyclodiphosphate synthase
MKKVAIIPAGGSGKRLKSDLAKQYLLLDKIPILAHTLNVFHSEAIVDEIILAVPEEDINYVQEEIIKKYGLTKVINIVAGGKERQDSVRNALAVISSDCDIVTIHDGVRPFVTGKMIENVIDAAQAAQAASVGVKAKDTIKEVEDSNFVVRTMPRQSIWITQTPQAFAIDVLKKAYETAYCDNYYSTDEASLVERIGIKVKMINGSYENIKITTPEDLVMAETLLRKKSGVDKRFCSGVGYDSHRFAEGRKLILGGSEIAFDKGLAGHSDADVLIHAICDALLGASGLGDIGKHFPDKDPAYENISSIILLKRVRQLIEAKRIAVNNVDATVIMEEPKLAPYSAAIVNNIASALNISEADVNIKAKTNEGMGFVGRYEGVAVLAVACVSKEVKNDFQT